jgi:hypothetical protein
MAFKMTGINFGKGTKGLPKKTHLKKDEYVPQSVDFNRGKELNVDLNDPEFFNMMHSDKDYISMDMRAEEEGKRGPGEDIERYDGYGYRKNTNEMHEKYPGVKDAGAGYNKFTLGQQNKQEKQDNQRFYTDLSESISDYRSKLPISGDLQMDDESFEAWKKSTGRTGANSTLRRDFENETTQALNIHNELKLAADAGYKPRGVDRLGVNMDEGDYKLNEGKHRAIQENKDLRHIAKANRDAQKTMDKANAYVEKHGGTVADFLRHRPHLRDNLQGIHSFGQVDVDTQGFYDDAMYADMSKEEKKEYDKKKEKEKQEELQIQSEIEANLPDDEKSDPSLTADSGEEGDDTSDNTFVDNTDDQDSGEGKTGDEEEFDPMDMNKDGYVDKWDRKEYNKMMEEQGQQEEVVAGGNDSDDEEEVVTANNGEKSGSGDLEGDYNKDGVVDYMDKRFAPMTKKPVFGTDEYYDFMKKKRTKEMGLTKRMFNIYDK